MKDQEVLFSEHALTCIRHSNVLAIKKNRKTISGDDIFRGIYTFMRNQEYFDIFTKVTGIDNTQALDEYYEKNISIDFGKSLFSDNKRLPFTNKMKSLINEYENNNISKTDFIELFYISYFDLSSQFEKYLNKHNIKIETLIENTEKVLDNNVINKIGAFAFFEIIAKILSSMNLDIKAIKGMDINDIGLFDNINNVLNVVEDSVESEIKEKGPGETENNGDKKSKKEAKKLTIEYFGTDLTREFKDGFVDPVIGREKEIDQMIYTLLRKNKNNPLLIGEAGVGKTAIVEGLAQRIGNGEVPEKLKNKRVFMLDMATLVAGTKYRGEFEARMKTILEEAMDPTNNIILFIDELHTIIGAGGHDNNDAAQMIKPLLARGKIKLIGATTFDEYQKHIEKDAALKRRFQELIVNEPNQDITKEILMGLKKTYEEYHGVNLKEESIENAIKLSGRYILNKHYPDKALDIIDEACARKSSITEKLEVDKSYKDKQKNIKKIQKQIEDAIDIQNYFLAAELKEKEDILKQEMQKIRMSKNIPIHLRPLVEKDDIGQVLSDKVGVPANLVNESEVDRLRRLDKDLNQKILGQDEAVKNIVDTISRSRLSVIQKNKPIGSFLFLGPTGVGKTYLAKLIAKDYFGGEDSLIRIDMSEFMEKYSVSKLIGSPAGYVGYEEGGNLTESVRRKPYSVVLFDEVEKASNDVLNILLQILDEGKLKDAKGRWVDFKSTIIIMTSNLGSEEFSKKKSNIGFKMEEGKKYQEGEFKVIKDKVMNEVKDFLSPELLNRIDYKVVFKPLSKLVMKKIFKLQINEFLDTWKDKSEVELPKFTDKKIDKIIEKIYDPVYGARPIERYINDEVESDMIKSIMKK